jgi:two-component system OmpR family response regulator
MRLLLVEDNPTIAEVIRRALKGSYQVDHCDHIEEALHLATVNTYATIVLDLGLPDGNGIELCRELRSNGITTPILVVTGEMEEGIKVAALDAGADDYLMKPFSLNELAARIRAVLRRGRSSTTNDLVSGRLLLDPVTRQVYYDGEAIRLRRKEFDLLELFMTHPYQVLTRDQILEQIWDHASLLITNTVDVHIKHLRDRVDRPFGLQQIKTVHGIGYKFEPTKT